MVSNRQYFFLLSVFKLISHDPKAILLDENPPSQLQCNLTTISNAIM